MKEELLSWPPASQATCKSKEITNQTKRNKNKQTRKWKVEGAFPVAWDTRPEISGNSRVILGNTDEM